jgi:hypothetical protein
MTRKFPSSMDMCTEFRPLYSLKSENPISLPTIQPAKWATVCFDSVVNFRIGMAHRYVSAFFGTMLREKMSLSNIFKVQSMTILYNAYGIMRQMQM